VATWLRSAITSHSPLVALGGGGSRGIAIINHSSTRLFNHNNASLVIIINNAMPRPNHARRAALSDAWHKAAYTHLSPATHLRSPAYLSAWPARCTREARPKANSQPAARSSTRDATSTTTSIRRQVDRQPDQREVTRETVHIHTCPPPPRCSFPFSHLHLSNS
jgi:hypothetical protein